MKELFFFALMSGLAILTATAQMDKLQLVVNSAGQTKNYVLADITRVHFGPDKLEISTSAATDGYAYEGTSAVVQDGDHTHNYVNGFCTCQTEPYQSATKGSDGSYEIDNGGKLFWYATQVLNGAAYDARLTADIDLEDRLWTPMGNDAHPYTGTFDGQGHAIKGLNVNQAGKYTGFIGYRTGTNAVKNFILSGKVTYTGNTAEDCVGGVVAWANGQNLIQDVWCAVDIEAPNATKNVRIAGIIAREETQSTIDRCVYAGTANGYATAMQVAGILGMAGNPGSGVTVSNNLFIGTLKATNKEAYVGGIVGYMGKSNFSCKNNLSIGTYEVPSGATRTGAIIGSCNRNINASMFVNNYMLSGQRVIGTSHSAPSVPTATAVTAETLADGSITAALGTDNWRQDTDNPVPSGGYQKADVNRDGTVDSADIVAVIKEMPDGDKKADVNGDGVIDSADIVAVIKAMK